MIHLCAKLEDYMLPCMWKKTFGIECMGCGIQRSIVLILNGEFVKAFYMYPAIYTLMLLFLTLIIHIKFQLKNGHKILLTLFLINISIIVISYFIKTFF